MGDLGVLGEAQRLVLHHLEQLEDGGGIEGDAAKDKGVQAGSQSINVCWPPPTDDTQGD